MMKIKSKTLPPTAYKRNNIGQESINRNSLRIERIFNTGIELVWQCWSNPELIKEWFGSDPNGTVDIVDIDFRKEGFYKIKFTDSDGSAHTCVGQYLNIDPLTNMKMTLEWENEPGHVTEINIDFIKFNEKTKKIFTLSHINPDTFHDYEFGWNSSFDQMENVLREK